MNYLWVNCRNDQVKSRKLQIALYPLSNDYNVDQIYIMRCNQRPYHGQTWWIVQKFLISWCCEHTYTSDIHNFWPIHHATVQLVSNVPIWNLLTCCLLRATWAAMILLRSAIKLTHCAEKRSWKFWRLRLLLGAKELASNMGTDSHQTKVLRSHLTNDNWLKFSCQFDLYVENSWHLSIFFVLPLIARWSGDIRLYLDFQVIRFTRYLRAAAFSCKLEGPQNELSKLQHLQKYFSISTRMDYGVAIEPR